jgi:hypothetical protein
MHDLVRHTITEIEAEKNCRVLFACESGSRAWGFPSPDSDYDVRFIYVHTLDWYLSLGKQSDTIDRMLPGDLDLGGWELRKALTLFAGCNLPLNEWLDSPIVYYANGDLAARLKELIPTYFNAKKALHHYLSLAEKIADQHLDGNRIGIKKLFYILRPLFACAWILNYQSMPPTHFPVMMGRELASGEIESWILELIERKRSAGERKVVSLSSEQEEWLISALRLTSERVNGFQPKPVDCSFEAVEDILMRIVISRLDLHGA